MEKVYVYFVSQCRDQEVFDSIIEVYYKKDDALNALKRFVDSEKEDCINKGYEISSDEPDIFEAFIPRDYNNNYVFANIIEEEIL